MAFPARLKRLAYPLLRSYATAFPHHRCRRRGIAYEVDLRELIDFRIYFGRGWEPATRQFLESTLQPGDTVLEVGANVGSLTLEIARRVGRDGTVHAIEPTGGAFAKLERNLSLNADLVPRVHLHRMLVTDGDGSTPTRELRWSWRIDRTAVDRERVEVPAVSIDRMVSTIGLTRLDLLKIDVDGYEMKVLRGATETLERFRPTILVELDEKSLAPQGDSVRSAVEFLEARGFRGTRLDGTPLSGQAASSGHTAHNAVFRAAKA